ncbi:hypothetical protein WJX77_005912 [Trebouxia sp. C0004]
MPQALPQGKPFAASKQQTPLPGSLSPGMRRLRTVMTTAAGSKMRYTEAPLHQCLRSRSPSASVSPVQTSGLFQSGEV